MKTQFLVKIHHVVLKFHLCASSGLQRKKTRKSPYFLKYLIIELNLLLSNMMEELGRLLNYQLLILSQTFLMILSWRKERLTEQLQSVRFAVA